MAWRLKQMDRDSGVEFLLGWIGDLSYHLIVIRTIYSSCIEIQVWIVHIIDKMAVSYSQIKYLHNSAFPTPQPECAAIKCFSAIQAGYYHTIIHQKLSIVKLGCSPLPDQVIANTYEWLHPWPYTSISSNNLRHPAVIFGSISFSQRDRPALPFQHILRSE